jgi:hypothetical protein
MKQLYGIQVKFNYQEFTDKQSTVLRKLYATNSAAVADLGNAIEGMIQRNLDKVNSGNSIATIDPTTISTTVIDFFVEE